MRRKKRLPYDQQKIFPPFLRLQSSLPGVFMRNNYEAAIGDYQYSDLRPSA